VQVTHLRLSQFRNLGLQEITFCVGTNLFCGANGQGKTNLLEAIYMLGYGRSFRTSTPKDCIRHGAREFLVQGRVEHGATVRELGVSLSAGGGKRLLLQRKPVSLAEFIGTFHTLAFTQEHLSVVRGAPAERRSFVDRALVTARPGHLQRLAAYGRALKQRNSLLRNAAESGRRCAPDLLDSWDDRLVEEGSRILRNRMQYVEELRQELSGGFSVEELLDIEYSGISAGLDPEGREIEESFRRRLQKARSLDERKGFTTVGPHRDDLRLLLNGRPLADFGSAGQQRSCLLSLYFAQLEIHRKSRGYYPVFLMDDVEAELDDTRLRIFLDHLGSRTQTFLTTAKERALPSLPAGARRFRVQEGAVMPVAA
jgi:DNA replication and repair protein RecF